VTALATTTAGRSSRLGWGRARAAGLLRRVGGGRGSTAVHQSYLDQISEQSRQAREEAEAVVEGGSSSKSSSLLSRIPLLGRVHWGSDLRGDWQTRLPLYKSDWRDGLNWKSPPAILFLYFACLLPAVAFGGIAFQVTAGALGVIEYLVACGASGMAYAIFSGQVSSSVAQQHERSAT
jgi:HCO3- transporter family